MTLVMGNRPGGLAATYTRVRLEGIRFNLEDSSFQVFVSVVRCLDFTV